MKVAAPAVISAIVNEIKPYKGGNDPLRALHDLDITDKHHLLVPVISVSELNGVTLKFGGAHMYDCTVRVTDSGELRVANVNPDSVLELENKGQPSFSVLFAKGQPLGGEPVIPTLHQLSQLTTGCVDTIEQAYRASTGLK
jgi:hypothetical protein